MRAPTRTMRWLFSLLTLPLCFLLASQSRCAERPHVDFIELKDADVNRPLAQFIKRSVEESAKEGSECLIIQISTYGGLGDAMQDIVQTMLNAEVPVAVYVAPKGAYAYSAGTFVLMAAHIAAMAPGTSVGAAHPVIISPGGEEGKESESQRIMTRKAVSALTAAARSIAEVRKRNVTWAEKAVRESKSASASEAKKLKVIDLVAEDVEDLLNQMDGRKVKIGKVLQVLRTKNAKLHKVEMTGKETFFHILSNPNIAYLLLMIAFMCMMMEIYNPGAIVPGTIAAICFVLFLLSASLLPINWVGVLLVLLGIIFFIAEIKVVSHGALTIAGIISLALGGYMLIDIKNPDVLADVQAFRVSWWALATGAGIFGGFFAFAVSAVIKAHRRKATTGKEGLLGKVGVARTALSPEGTVFVEGTYWSAEVVDGAAEAGAKVEVIGMDGLKLKVKRLN